MSHSTIGSLAFATVATLGLVSATTDEEKIPFDQVPAAVVKAVKEKFPKAEVVESSKEVEDGKTTYELSLKDAGRAIDVSAKPDGSIVEIEKEIDPKDLPAAVSAAVKAKYAGATMKKAEEIIEGDETEYEVVIATGDGKTIELKLEANGKITETEEQTKKD